MEDETHLFVSECGFVPGVRRAVNEETASEDDADESSGERSPDSPERGTPS